MLTFDLSFIGPHMKGWDIILAILMWGAVVLVLLALSIVVGSVRKILWIGVAALGVCVGIWLAETFHVGAIMVSVAMQPYYLAQRWGEGGLVGCVVTIVYLIGYAALNGAVMSGPVRLLTRNEEAVGRWVGLGATVAYALFIFGLLT